MCAKSGHRVQEMGTQDEETGHRVKRQDRHFACDRSP